jgi:hypothetical protein
LIFQHSELTPAITARERAPSLDGASGAVAKTNGGSSLFNLEQISNCNLAAQLWHTGLMPVCCSTAALHLHQAPTGMLCLVGTFICWEPGVAAVPFGRRLGMAITVCREPTPRPAKPRPLCQEASTQHGLVQPKTVRNDSHRVPETVHRAKPRPLCQQALTQHGLLQRKPCTGPNRGHCVNAK